MKKLSIFLLLVLLLSGCVTIKPVAFSPSVYPQIEKVLVVSTMKEIPIMTFYGTTAFGNSYGEIDQFDFDVNAYIEEFAMVYLQAAGLDAHRDPELTKKLNNVYGSWNYKKELRDIPELREYDAIFIFLQGQLRRGLRPEEGVWLRENGFILNNTLFRKDDHIIFPYLIRMLSIPDFKEIAKTGVFTMPECTTEVTGLVDYVRSIEDIDQNAIDLLVRTMKEIIQRDMPFQLSEMGF